MIHEIFPVGLLRCNCSILGDERTREAIVVDPGDDIPRILLRLARHLLTVVRIVVTHAHIDHIAGARELKRITGAPVTFNQADLPLLAMMGDQAKWLGVATPEVEPPDDDLPDDSMVTAGSLRVRVIHTPGHTPGSVCLHLPDESLLLAGDTLFAGGVGRTDFPLGNGHALLKSIHTRLMILPDSTRVIPGHGDATSIGEERETNPFLVV